MKEHASCHQCPSIDHYSGFEIIRTSSDLLVSSICLMEMFHLFSLVQFWSKEELCGFVSIINRISGPSSTT